MKNKVWGVIVIIAAAVWSVWSIAAGIIGLARSGTSPLSASSPKGSLCEFKAVYAKEIYNIDHKLLVILPLGTERFYFVAGEANAAPMLVKASRGWFESNFNENGIAKREVTITGEIREYKSSSAYKLAEVNRELAAADSSISVSETRYADTLYIPRHIMQIAAGSLAISVGVVIAVLIGISQKAPSSRAVKPLVIFLIAAVLALIPLVMGLRVM